MNRMRCGVNHTTVMIGKEVLWIHPTPLNRHQRLQRVNPFRLLFQNAGELRKPKLVSHHADDVRGFCRCNEFLGDYDRIDQWLFNEDVFLRTSRINSDLPVLFGATCPCPRGPR